MVSRAVLAALTLLNIALAAMWYFLFWRGGGYVSLGGPPAWTPTIEYKDFVAILLTSLAAMIAVTALFVGAAAIWTYKEGMNIVRDAVEKTTRDEIARRVRDVPPAETTPSEAEQIAAAVASDTGNVSEQPTQR